MSAKEPEFSELADALKREGNAYFKLENFEEAYRAYTLAITEQPQSPSLFSNRSITNIKLGDYDEAFEDAKRATLLDPGWDKAYGRLATAAEALGIFGEASEAFQKALEKSSSDTMKNIYKVGLERTSDRWLHVRSFEVPTSPLKKKNPYERPQEKFQRLSAEGHVFVSHSAVARNGHTWMACEEAWQSARKTKKVTMADGSVGVYGSGTEIAHLVGTLVGDPQNCFHLSSAQGWENPFDFINDLYASSMGRCDQPSEHPPLSARDKILWYEKKRQQNGWDDPKDTSKTTLLGIRNSLSVLIRGHIMNGFMAEFLKHSFGWAAYEYKQALELIEEGFEVWPGQGTSDKAGTTFTATFFRAILSRRILCLQLHSLGLSSLVKHAVKTPTAPQLKQIRALSWHLFASCAKDPIPLADPHDHSAVIERLSFYVSPMAEAFFYLAWVHEQTSWNKKQPCSDNTSQNHKVWFKDPEQAEESQYFYLQAAMLFPKDDLRCSAAIWCALYMTLSTGGMTLLTFRKLASHAQSSRDEAELWFGPAAAGMNKDDIRVLEIKHLCEKFSRMARDADQDECEFIVPRVSFQNLDGTQKVGDYLNDPRGRSPSSKRVSEEVAKLLQLYANPPRVYQHEGSNVAPDMPIDP